MSYITPPPSPKTSASEKDSGFDKKPDFTDGRNTLSTGGRPPSECRAPLRPAKRMKK